ncbi:MAG: beta-propeller domain-containing protein [Bdellovibrionota bacterium]
MQGSLEFKDDAFQTETVEYKSEDSIIPLQKQTITSDPLMIKNNAIAGVPCQQIVKQPSRDMDFNLTQVASIDVTNLDAAQIKAALGGGEQIYMSNKSLYIIKSGVNWQPWVRPKDEEITDNSASATVSVSNSSYYGRLQEGLAILKADIAADSGGIEFVAAGIVLGQAKDQYSFKEYADGSLAVATTTYMPLPEVAVAADEDGSSSASELVEFVNSDEPWSQIVDDTRGRNHLWVLAQKDKSLEVVRAAKNFGEIGEDIRSVRFMDGYAYIVTFKKTDPLYSFDMSVPSEFKMVGKLKIPGFSMYMHPAGDQIIGVGFDADDQGEFAWYQGIQVSLFDVSDPTNMQRTDNKIHGQRGSSSEVTSDAHAFFYSEEDNIFALPVVELAGKEGNIGSQYGSELQFSGVVLYSIEGEKLQEKGRISHFDFIPSECQSILKQGQWWQNNTRSLDINRVFKVDEKILTISRYGIKQYGLLDFSTPIAMTHFPEADGCSTDAFID